MPRRRLVVVVAVVAAALAVPASAHAGPNSSTAIVSLGDSYMSGEAGRWQGNSINPARNRDGTDRAAFN